MANRGTARSGAMAEEVAAGRLIEAGWRVLGRNVRVGRRELDIVAVDPTPPARLVAVEVRYRTRRDYGVAEESFDRGKQARTLAALMTLRSAGRLDDGTIVPALTPAVDLIVIEPVVTPRAAIRVRHHRDVLV